jgi:hypothetical protein
MRAAEQLVLEMPHRHCGRQGAQLRRRRPCVGCTGPNWAVGRAERVFRTKKSSLSLFPLYPSRGCAVEFTSSTEASQVARRPGRNGPSWLSLCSSSSAPSSPPFAGIGLAWGGAPSHLEPPAWDSSIPLVRNLTCLYESFQSETSPDFLGRRNSVRIGTSLLYHIDLQRGGFDDGNELGVCLLG